jgi:HipA-like protein
MKMGKVYNNKRLAGIISFDPSEGYVFEYDSHYHEDDSSQSISLTLPKSKKRFVSEELFPFFFGLLSEGVNKQTQCRLLRIDENDHFTLLLKTAHSDTIGSITVEEVKI